MSRHRQRKRYKHPGAYYVEPTRFVRVPGEFGDADSWEPAGVLPEALFAPGPTDEGVKLSEAANHRAQLFWDEQVPISSTDQVEVPELFDGDTPTRWRLSGHPSHWPKGTNVVLERD